MPRVHRVKAARKDYPDAGIKKGDTYYWWKFRYGGKRKSKTLPKRSQLTQSPFLASLYDLQDEIDFDRDRGDLECSRDSLVDNLNSLRDECEESLQNMPEHLQETSDSGMLIQERIEALEGWISDLESVDCEIDESLEDEDREERIQEIVDELSGIEGDL